MSSELESKPNKNEILEYFYKAVTSIENVSECEKFFHDICTPKELDQLAERLSVAKLLGQNYSYRKIGELTGASTTTVTRVARFSTKSDSGYQILIQRMREEYDGQRP